MDPHLKRIPCLATLTARRFARSDLQNLRREANGALDPQILRLGPLDEFLAHSLESLHLTRGEGDADFVDFLENWTVVSDGIPSSGGKENTYGAFAEILLGLLVGHCNCDLPVKT